MSAPVELYDLLMRVRERGYIVSSSRCSTEEIAIARAEGRLFVDRDGFGYVYRTDAAPKS